MDNENEEQEEEKSVEQTKELENLAENVIDLQFSRKAYCLLNHKNHVPELIALFEGAHHVEHDQKHHVKVPKELAGTARHMLDGVLREIAREERRGRSNYGSITVKNIRLNMGKLHI